MDWQLVLAGLVIGFVIGLTGMGGGALMTPVLVLFFGVQPLAAVSSDLVASLVMKPVGAAVHQRRGTVHLPLVRLLCYGSVPAAFCSVLALRYLADPEAIQPVVRAGLGVALALAVTTMLGRLLIDWRRERAGRSRLTDGELRVRPVLTVLVGVVGGLVVGVTSVGSGSLIIVALTLLYPGLTMARLVGTDLVQAIPLVGAAALGHVLFGDVRLDVTVPLLIGAVPAVYLGARLSSGTRTGFIRPALLVVLMASALKLFGVPDTVVVWAAGAPALLALVGWLVVLSVRLRQHRRARSRAPAPSGS